MFFCDKCRVAKGWPESAFKSRGRCEVCSERASCNDIPAAQLPMPLIKPEPQFNVGQREQILVSRTEANFDRACDEACRGALSRFRFDGDGYALNVKGYDRSRHGLVVEFRSFRKHAGMGGQECVYVFEAWVE